MEILSKEVTFFTHKYLKSIKVGGQRKITDNRHKNNYLLNYIECYSNIDFLLQ